MGIKDIYYYFEDKWYDLLDKLNSKIPVYKITDQVDKVIPSFLLFILIVIFLLLLLLYFVQFGTSSAIELNTIDAASKAALSGVRVYGSLEGNNFDEITDPEGIVLLAAGAGSANTYELLLSFLFGTPDVEYSAIISAEKNGYNTISNRSVTINLKRATISLTKIAGGDINFQGGGGGGNYPNSTTVVMDDEATGAPILDATSTAYIKYRCANKTINSKTAYDEDDGSLDGAFNLSEGSCQFVVTEAYAPGYIAYTDLPVTLPATQSRHYIQMQSVAITQTGSAKIYVSEKGSNFTKLLPLVNVTLINSSGMPANSDYTDNSGVAIITGLYPGTYKVTAESTDNNYSPLLFTDDVNITIQAGITTEKSIQLEKMDVTNLRFVKIKVVDENNSPLSGVSYFPQSTHTSGNGSDSNGTKIGACQDYRYRTISNCVSDSNGQIIVGQLKQSDSGKIVVALYKTGYVTAAVVPTLVIQNGAFTTVQMNTANSSNSGSALLRVKNKQSQLPLFSARTMLYMNLTSPQINGIIIRPEGIDTNESGMAVYNYLPIGSDKNYFARANYQNVDSGASAAKKITAGGQQIDFNLQIDMALAVFKVKLIDNNGNAIPTAASAIVKVSQIDSNSQILPQTTTVLAFHADTNRFVSEYKTRADYLLTADLNEYIPNFAFISQYSIVNGDNLVTIRLYPKSIFEPGSDANVKAVFNGFYSSPAQMQLGNKLSSLDKNGAFASYDLLLANDLNYTTLMGAVQFNDKGKIIVFDSQYITPFGLSDSNRFICNPSPAANAVNDDNFYIQGPECYKVNEDQNARSAGVRWINPRGPGVYSYALGLDFAQANNGDSLSMKFFGKEKHDTNESESRGDLNFTIGEGLPPEGEQNSPLLRFKATLNSEAMIQTHADFACDAATQICKAVQQGEAKKISYSNPGTFSLTVVNDDNGAVTVTSVKLYSYFGPVNDFNKINPESGALTPSGYIKFASKQGQQIQTLATNVNLAKDANVTYNTTVNSILPKAHTYIVATVTVTAAGKTPRNYRFFIDTTSSGIPVMLANARFLAGVPDQNFTGEVYAYSAQNPVALTEVNLQALPNCASAANPFNTTGEIYGENENFFKAQIIGDYNYGTACLKIRGIPTDSNYDDLNAVLTAGTGGIQDPTLSCVSGTIPDSVITGLSIENAFKEDYLQWDGTKNIIIRNSCSKSMQIAVVTGLEVNPQSVEACQILAPSEECTIQLLGRNQTYNPQVQFSDVLGVFPVYIKAKPTAVASARQFALADTLKIHLQNHSDCFAISKDVFDFRGDTDRANFFVNNNCQYAEFGDYFIPRMQLDLLGTDLNTPNPKYGLIDFNYVLEATGGEFATQERTRAREAPILYWANAPSLPSVVDGNYRNYSGIRVQIPRLSAAQSTHKLLYKWVDYNSGSGTIGARVSGNFLVHYRNGSTQTVAPRINFSLENEGKCVCDGVLESGGGCYISGTEMHCLYGDEASGEFGQGYKYALGYINFPQGDVDYIDFNMTGNIDPDNLVIRAIAFVNYQETILVPVPVANENPEVIGGGAYKIFPLEGATYLLKDLVSGTESAMLNSKIPICKKLLAKEGWLAGTNFYWTTRSTMDYESAVEYCSTNPLGGNPANQLNQSVAPAEVKNNLRDYNWINGTDAVGLWLGGCTASNCLILKAPTPTTEPSIITDDNSMLQKYLPLCRITPQLNYMPSSAAECQMLGVSCDSNTGQCSAPQITRFATLDSVNLLSKPVPTVRVRITSISSGGRQLNPDAVVMWIEGGYLKARFLGEDYEGFNDNNISGTIIERDVQGDEYGVLTATDYIN